MKLAVFLIFLSSFQAVAYDATSQQRINLDLKNKSISEIIKKIEERYRYRFVYNDAVTNSDIKLDLYAKNATVDYVMQNMLKATAFTYKKINKGLVVIIGQPGETLAITVEGRVTDPQGQPLAGVSILEKGTSNGVISGADGSYRLKVANENALLVFSIVGYHTREISIQDNSYSVVVLEPIENKLEEVVVVGYGTQRQKDLTGAVSAINSDDFNQGLVLSPQQSIQGKLTGVNISQNSGKPGGSNTIRIRGGTSLTQSNDPLYVIDGMPISNSAGVGQANINSNAAQNVFDMEPTNPLMTLNPDDIASVTVLKDASATAIYGSRGANGVIVITTKKGNGGAPRVNVNASWGTASVAGTLDVLSAEEYRKAAAEYGLTLDDGGASTNWQEEIYQPAFMQDYDLSLSGGSGKTTYRASLGFGDQQSIIIGSDFKRTNGRININHTALDDRLSFDLRVNYGQTYSAQSPVSNTVGSEFASSMLYEALVFNPTLPVRDEQGNYVFVPPYRVNPVSFSDQVIDQLTNNRFLGSLSTTYKISRPLSINLNIGYTNQNINRNSYISKANLLGQGMDGYTHVQRLEDYSKLLETVLRYKEQFGRHQLEAIAGYSWQYFLNAGNSTSANGFLSDEFKWYSLQAASTISDVSSFQGSNKLISFYARANYSFDDRILFTGTVRRDGSSRFGSGNKWGIFPSGSIAWRLSKEKFFTLEQINDLKLRVSYGVTGNQEIGNLNSLTTLGATTTGYIVGGERITTVLPQQYPNPNLKWEQTAQLNIGLDLALFNGRLNGAVDWYNKKTTDLLLRIPVPTPSAIRTQLANVGSVQNRGLEISLTGRILDGQFLGWESGFNISFNRNKVLQLANEQFTANNIQIAPLQGTVSLGRFAQLVIPGEPLGTFWGPRFTGVVDGKETYANGGADTIIGVAQPKYIFGFNNTFTYKRLTLNFLLRGSVGNDVFNLTAANMSYLSNLPGKNVLAGALTSGLDRDAPKQYSSRWIEDGSFLRLDNCSLSYNLNVSNSFLAAARVFVAAQNLLLITGYSGLDPEVNAEVSGTGTAPLGVDYLSYPRARSLSIGVNLSF